MATAELDIVIKTVDQSSPAIKGIDKSIQDLAKTAIGIGTVIKGFDFLRDSVKKAAAEEKNLRTLQSVIENQGEVWDKVKGKVTSYINTMERNTLFNDEQLIPSMKQLVNAGMNVEQAMKAMNTVTDLATAKGIDLETSANLIGKAYMGNTEALKRYGIVATDFNSLMEQVNKKFGGSAQKDMDGYAGSVKRLEQTIDANMKLIGNFYIPILIQANNWLDKLFGLGGETKSAKLEYAEGMIQRIESTLKRNKELAEYGEETVIKVFGRDASLTAKQIETLTKELIKYKNEVKKLKEVPAEQPPVAFTPEKSQEEKDAEVKWHADQMKRAEEYAKAEEQMYQDINQSAMTSYEFTMSLVETESQRLLELGLSEVEVAQWVSAQKIEAIEKEYQLKAKANKIIDTMISGSAEMQKYIIADLLEEFLQAEAKKEAALALKSLLTLDFVGAGLHSAAAAGLTYGASVVHQETERDKALEKAKQEAKIAEASGAFNPALTTGGGTPTMTGGYASAQTSIASPKEQVTYNINNTYNLNAGAVLGDEFSIDSAFKKLMERYDMNKLLTLSNGA